MSAEVEKADVLVRVDWGEKSSLRELRLSELQGAIDIASDWPQSFECPSLDVYKAIVTLAQFADPAMDVIEVNGIECKVARTPTGGFGFVPNPSVEGVEILATSSVSWLSGGPCEMTQEETIYRFENLYWVEAQGDNENRLVVVGQFEIAEQGIIEASQASAYFSVDDSGNVICELDGWSDEE
jgi:hypothetical protein